MLIRFLVMRPDASTQAREIAALSEREALALVLGALRHQARPIGPGCIDVGFVPVGPPGKTILCRACDDDYPLRAPANRLADCRKCGRRIQYQPTSSTGHRICYWCAVGYLVEGGML
jgi:hypothetical protein